MQVDQSSHHGGSLTPLVHAHRPKAQDVVLTAPEPGDRAQVFFADAAKFAGFARCPGLDRLGEPRKAIGCAVDEVTVEAAVLEHEARQAMQQGEVGARGKREVVIGNLGCVRAAGVDHHDGESLGITLFAFQQALEQHGMALGRVGADQEGHRAVIEILVTAGWTVGAEAAGVAGHS